ncbi:hypothetical protein [uncultured Veillonella sp.]|nr:hypothetical protein [uncultured Veillonella sp.]
MIDGNVEKQLKQLEVFSDQEFNVAFKDVWTDLIRTAQPNQENPVGIR